MVCPKCKHKMTFDYCMHCGYMKNGGQIDTKKKMISPLEMVLGGRYFQVTRNENKKTIFFLGPFYLAYCNYFFAGFLLGTLDIFILYLAIVFSNVYLSPMPIIPTHYLGYLLFFLLNRFFWVAFCNPIYLFLLSSSLKRQMKKKGELSEEDYEKLGKRSLWKLVLALALLVEGLLLLILF